MMHHRSLQEMALPAHRFTELTNQIASFPDDDVDFPFCLLNNPLNDIIGKYLQRGVDYDWV